MFTVAVGAIKIHEGVALYSAVNPITNFIYLSYPLSNFILPVDINTRSSRQQIFASSPENIAVNPATNRTYIISKEGIYDIEGYTGQFEIMIKGLSMRSGGGIDINPVTNTIYTTSLDSDTLAAIDATSYIIKDKVVVGKNPQGVVVDSSSNKIYVANHDSESISVIDANQPHQSHKVIDNISTTGLWSRKLAIRPTFILINALARLLYVQATTMEGGYVEHAPVSYESNTMLVIDLVTKKKIKELKLDTISRQGIGYNRSNNAIYTKKFQQEQRAIAKYDSHAQKVLGIIKLEPGNAWKGPFGDSFFNESIAINPVTNKVYVSNSEKSILYEIDG